MAARGAARSTIQVSIDHLAALSPRDRLARLAQLADQLNAGHRLEVYEGAEPDPLAVLATFDDSKQFRRWTEEQGYG